MLSENKYNQTNKSKLKTLYKVRDSFFEKLVVALPSRSSAHLLLSLVEVVMNDARNPPKRRLEKNNKVRVFGGVDHLETENLKLKKNLQLSGL